MENQNRFIPNSFQVPNAIVDQYLYHMSCNASRCYLLICRKTRGWGKTQDSISISQFQDYLLIKDPRTIRKALKELIVINLIEQKEIPGKPTVYTLVESPKPPTKNVGGTKNVLTLNERGTPDKKCTPQKSSDKEEDDEEINIDEFNYHIDNFIHFLKSENNIKIKNPISYKKKLLLNYESKDLQTHTLFNEYKKSHHYITAIVMFKNFKGKKIIDTEFDGDNLCLKLTKNPQIENIDEIFKINEKDFSNFIKIFEGGN